jgi:hypothetical protein
MHTKHHNRGFTFVEITIYTILLSFLLAGFLEFAYAIHIRNIELNHEIQDKQKGFIAVIAVILLATGALVFSVTTMTSAISYAESVYLKELRIQAELNAQACLDHIALMVVKDYFMAGDFEIEEFGCRAKVVNDLSGVVALNVSAKLGKVVIEHGRSLTIEDGAINSIDIY